MADLIQKQLTHRNCLVAQLAGISRRAERLLDALDEIPIRQVIDHGALDGLDRTELIMLTQAELATAQSALDRLDRMLVANGILKPFRPEVVDLREGLDLSAR